mgnify:FL=1
MMQGWIGVKMHTCIANKLETDSSDSGSNALKSLHSQTLSDRFLTYDNHKFAMHYSFFLLQKNKMFTVRYGMIWSFHSLHNSQVEQYIHFDRLISYKSIALEKAVPKKTRDTFTSSRRASASVLDLPDDAGHSLLLSAVIVILGDVWSW